jgi:hypothetical protein
MRARIDWSKSPHDLGKAVVKYGHDLVFEGLVDYLKQKGPAIVAQMQREAPWTDRTGQARRELRYEVDLQGTTATLYLITGAPHGQYLELRWGGRYAVVSPTIPRAGIAIGNELRGMLAR